MVMMTCLYFRTQVASLSAELSAERRVSEESREQVAIARARANKYQTQVRVQTALPSPAQVMFAVPYQVANSQSMVKTLQDMLERQTMGATPTVRLTTPTHKLDGLTNGIPKVTGFEGEADFVMLPNHLKSSHLHNITPPTSVNATPTSPLTPASSGSGSLVTTPTPKKGSIISM